MPISTVFAHSQLARFEAFPGYPRRQDHREEIADYLAAISQSDEQCRRICDRLLENCRRFPLPADIRAAAQDEHSGASHENCHRCRDMGWLVTDAGIVRCPCTRDNQQILPRLYGNGLPDHPEVVVGIPNAVITAKPAFKEKYAKQCLYDGPLTLQAAVDAGAVSFAEAQRLVRRWEIAHREKFKSELQQPAKPKPPGFTGLHLVEEIS